MTIAVIAIALLSQCHISAFAPALNKRRHGTQQSPLPLRISDDPNQIDWGGENTELFSAWDEEHAERDVNRRSRSNSRDKFDKRRKDGGKGTSFRENFRGTRVFVQGLPLDTTWQELKDHFRTAGTVVFASVSVNPDGSSKGCGIVQYETAADARNAIAIMREYPLNEHDLFVREDYQEKSSGRSPYPATNRRGGGRNAWTCANDDNAETSLSPRERASVLELIKNRDASRRRRDFETADAAREELKYSYNVHIDDRIKMWWCSVDNAVPTAVSSIKGDGAWDKKLKPWRQIPTTEENDACVNAAVVEGLLKRRDIARREKAFDEADRLLEEARSAPDGGLSLRIHDDSRTWRIWTERPPPVAARGGGMGPTEQALELVGRFDPEKLDEVRNLLERFPGREYNILKKLKQRYNEG